MRSTSQRQDDAPALRGETHASAGGTGGAGGAGAQTSIDLHHEEHGHGTGGWRRGWRVARLALVAAACIVVALNLIRCLSVTPASAHGSRTPAPQADPSGGQLPKVLREEQAVAEGVGSVVDFSFTDREGRSATLKDVAGSKGTVVALTSASCPLSRKWAPAVGQVARKSSSSGVVFIAVNVNPSDSDASVAEKWKSAGLDGPGVIAVKAGGLAVAQTLKAHSTTEVFVLDSARRLVYRGAPDDQYGIGTAKAAPSVSWLNAAVDAVIAGRTPTVGATTSPGCALEFPGAPKAEAKPTWSGSVASIIYQNCVSCHHEGGIGPFALQTYEQVKDRASTIRRVVAKGQMPPWFAAPPENGHASPWANDRTIPARDKETLLAWLNSGTEPGDLKAAPKAPSFASEWTIGTPDLVVELPKEVEVKATGVMPYVNVEVPTGLTQDKWVAAVEVLPTARQAVHHVLVFVGKEGERGGGGRLAARLRGEEGFFAAYVPGGGPQEYGDGFAKKLSAGSTLRFQLHYTPTGEATTDRTRIGFKFSSTPPKHEVRTIGIADLRLSIPADEADHVESKTINVPADAVVTAFMPHMHLRGKSFEYTAVTPDGQKQTLLSVPQWDFNWQISYRLKEPLNLPRGTKLTATAHYDNSAENPSNPDHTRNVRWGQQSTDEMLIGYVEYYLPGVKPGGVDPLDP
ncbi:MAG: redoxin family protein [Phycisphaerales bacterium]